MTLPRTRNAQVLRVRLPRRKHSEPIFTLTAQIKHCACRGCAHLLNARTAASYCSTMVSRDHGRRQKRPRLSGTRPRLSGTTILPLHTTHDSPMRWAAAPLTLQKQVSHLRVPLKSRGTGGVCGAYANVGSQPGAAYGPHTKPSAVACMDVPATVYAPVNVGVCGCAYVLYCCARSLSLSARGATRHGGVSARGLALLTAGESVSRSSAKPRDSSGVGTGCKLPTRASRLVASCCRCNTWTIVRTCDVI